MNAEAPPDQRGASGASFFAVISSAPYCDQDRWQPRRLWGEQEQANRYQALLRERQVLKFVCLWSINEATPASLERVMPTRPESGRRSKFLVLRGRLTFANLTALLALFVALGGTSYAALQLPKNSVGAKQIKKNAVTSKKVKPGSLLNSDFKASERASLRGPQGERGIQGAQGPQGPQGLQGVPGAARAYGEVRINGGGNYELVPGTTKGVVAIGQGGGGNSAACIQLDSSINAATAITVATSNLNSGGGFNTQLLVARPLAYCGGVLSNVTEVITTLTDFPGGSVKRAFVFAVM